MMFLANRKIKTIIAAAAIKKTTMLTVLAVKDAGEIEDELMASINRDSTFLKDNLSSLSKMP